MQYQKSILCGAALTWLCLYGIGSTAEAGDDQCDPQETQQWFPSDGKLVSQLGVEIAVDGDAAVVSAPATAGGGAAYILQSDDSGLWTEVAMLLPSDGAGNDAFGTSIGIDGDTIVIGSPNDDDNGSQSGSAYIFQNDGNGNWSQIQKLTAHDGATLDRFGRSVSIFGDTVMIGADQDDDNGGSSGSVYVFHDDGSGRWNEGQKLSPSNATSGQFFGRSVAIEGDAAVIGAFTDANKNGIAAGAAYIFRDDGTGNWIEEDKLIASAGDFADWFGWDVDISDGTVVVGSPAAPNPNAPPGEAYLYQHDGSGNWIEIAMLTASDGESGDRFGFSVAISDSTVLVGVPGDDDACPPDQPPPCNSGSAYLFHGDDMGNWSEVAKLTASDMMQGDGFGRVDVDDDVALIGAPGDDDNGAGTGAVYIFELNCSVGVPGDVNGDGEVNVQDLVALVHSFGPCPGEPEPCPADLNEDGIVDVNDLWILLHMITPGNPGGPNGPGGGGPP